MNIRSNDHTYPTAMMWQEDEVHRQLGQRSPDGNRRSSTGNQNGGRGEQGGRIGSLIASTVSKIQDSLREETVVAASTKEGKADNGGRKWKEVGASREKGIGMHERSTVARGVSMSHASTSTVIVAKVDYGFSSLHQSYQEVHQDGQQFVHKSYSHAVLREANRSQRRRRSTMQHIALPSIQTASSTGGEVEGQECEIDIAGGSGGNRSGSSASWRVGGLHRRSSSGGVDKWHRNNSMNLRHRSNLMNLKSDSHDDKVDANGPYSFHNSSLTSSGNGNANVIANTNARRGGGGSSLLRHSGSFGDMAEALSRGWEATQSSLDNEINLNHVSVASADDLLLQGGVKFREMNLEGGK